MQSKECYHDLQIASTFKVDAVGEGSVSAGAVEKKD